MEQLCFIVAAAEGDAFPSQVSLEVSDCPVLDVGLHLLTEERRPAIYRESERSH